MSLVRDLKDIVGTEFVTDDSEILKTYSKDYSFVQPRMANCVAYPNTSEEIQRVLKYANKHLIAVTPRSSKIGFYGAGIPCQGGIIVDLSRMNRILKVDPGNKFVKIEPGVTWGQIYGEIKEHDMMVCNPLLPHSLKSVVTSSMENEPLLISKTEYNETFLTAEIVLPNGELYLTGTAMGKGMASGTFPDCLYPGGRLFLNVQGTFGIVTWANLKAEWLPVEEKLLFLPFEGIEDLAEPIYRIQRRMIGRECFVLNRFNMAAILAERWPQDFDTLLHTLPPWTLILALAGLHRHPSAKIDYEEEAVLKIASELQLPVMTSIPGIPGLEKKIFGILRRPWPEETYWKFKYRGSCHDVFFHTTLDRVAEFTKEIEQLAAKHGYSTSEVGVYLQPIEHGRACYCQYGFACDPQNTKDSNRVRELYLEVSGRVISLGGLFTTPYGAWADMVYRNAGILSEVMKVIKNVVDPNHIMNPGKLCFW